MLLQEIRARQVLKEEGLNLPIKIIHNVPKTIIGDREFSLIFPKYMFEYENEKNIDILFVGKITEKRAKFLSNFNAMIIDSDRGRIPSIKEKDIQYFNLMSRSKFVLCPDGDFTWTYRFFEAIIFKAVPIIENDTYHYDGYKFYRKGDDFEYKKDWIDHNLNKLKKEMTWN